MKLLLYANNNKKNRGKNPLFSAFEARSALKVDSQWIKVAGSIGDLYESKIDEVATGQKVVRLI